MRVHASPPHLLLDEFGAGAIGGYHAVELALDAFDISIGVRRGDNALLQRLNDSLERNHTAISAILAEYHVPVLLDAFAPR